MILKDSRGVAAILVAMMITGLVGIAGFATDVGYIYYTRFKLQNTADATVLAAIRDIENKDTVGDNVITQNNLNPAELEEKRIELGEWDAESETFSETESPATNRMAVRVYLKRQIPAFFGRIFGKETYSPSGEAVAAFIPKGAVVTVGSTTLVVDTSKSALDGLIGGLLGTTIDLDVAGWKGLYYGQIDLIKFLNLAKVLLNTGDIDTVLNSNVTLLQFLDLAIGALDEADYTAKVALNDLKLEVAALKWNLKLGDLIQIDLNDKNKLVMANVNLLQMITATAELFNHQNAVLAAVPINNLLGLVDVDLRAKVIEPPVIKVAEVGSTIHTGQVRVFLKAEVLGGLLLRIPLYLELGAGDAKVTGINPNGVTIDGSSSLAKVFLGDISPVKFFGDATHPADETLTAADYKFGDIALAGVVKAKVHADAQGGEQSEMNFTPPFPETQSVYGSLGTTLSQLLTSLTSSLKNDPNSLQVAGLLPLGQLLGTILNPISDAILGPLLEGLLNPITQLLGVFPGRTDITVNDFAYTIAIVK